MRAEGVSLLAKLGGASSSFVSLGKAGGAFVGVHVDPGRLPRNPYRAAIGTVRELVRSCTTLPDLPPSSIAVVYSKGSSAQKWYATPPCPHRAEKELARALHARSKKRTGDRCAAGSGSKSDSDSDYTSSDRSTSSDDDGSTTSDDDGSAGSGDDSRAPRGKKRGAAGADVLREMSGREQQRNQAADELYAWAEACSDDETGYALPMHENDILPTTLSDGRIRYPEVVFRPESGDNMLGMLITEEVRRRQALARVPAKAPALGRNHVPATAVARKKRRVPLQHLGVRNSQGNLVSTQAPQAPQALMTWFVDQQGLTVLGVPPASCTAHGVVRDGVLVGR